MYEIDRVLDRVDTVILPLHAAASPSLAVGLSIRLSGAYGCPGVPSCFACEFRRLARMVTPGLSLALQQKADMSPPRAPRSRVYRSQQLQVSLPTGARVTHLRSSYDALPSPCHNIMHSSKFETCTCVDGVAADGAAQMSELATLREMAMKRKLDAKQQQPKRKAPMSAEHQAATDSSVPAPTPEEPAALEPAESAPPAKKTRLNAEAAPFEPGTAGAATAAEPPVAEAQPAASEVPVSAGEQVPAVAGPAAISVSHTAPSPVPLPALGSAAPEVVPAAEAAGQVAPPAAAVPAVGAAEQVPATTEPVAEAGPATEADDVLDIATEPDDDGELLMLTECSCLPCSARMS